MRQSRTDTSIIGKKFNKLTIISIFKDGYQNGKAWESSILECKCDCGNTCYKKRSLIVKGTTTSCGCNRSKHGNQSAAWKGFGEISQSTWTQILRHARERNLIVEVDIQYVWNLFLKQNRKCALSGIELSFTRSRNISGATASLDRIDSTKGYVEGNIQWVHTSVNRMKFDLPQEDFIRFCKLISNNL